MVLPLCAVIAATTVRTPSGVSRSLAGAVVFGALGEGFAVGAAEAVVSGPVGAAVPVEAGGPPGSAGAFVPLGAEPAPVLPPVLLEPSGRRFQTSTLVRATPATARVTVAPVRRRRAGGGGTVGPVAPRYWVPVLPKCPPSVAGSLA